MRNSILHLLAIISVARNMLGKSLYWSQSYNFVTTACDNFVTIVWQSWLSKETRQFGLKKAEILVFLSRFSCVLNNAVL